MEEVKVRQVSGYINTVFNNIPHPQTNIVLGLDSDARAGASVDQHDLNTTDPEFSRRKQKPISINTFIW
jgi:hypothetical protein